MKKIFFYFLILISIWSCKTQDEQQRTLYRVRNSKYFAVSGRVDELDSSLVMISPASKLAFKNNVGDTIRVLARTDQKDLHAFLALAVNGTYRKKIRVQGDTTNTIKIPLAKTDTLIELYKATEASTGNLVINGIKAKDLKAAPKRPKLKIEFIGNSITSGFGNDNKDYPCGEGAWFDAHNAYFSYASIAARRLHADFILSSVSGWGMYRNSNTPGPTIPEVYDNLYLNTDSTKTYTAENFKPDLISINLGTNDLSDGDGEHERLPFESDRFIEAYLGFISHLMETRGDPKIAILDSPMISGEKEEILHRALDSVAGYFASRGKKIYVFDFKKIPETGCGAHPSIEEDNMMADQIVPFYQKILDLQD